MSIMNPGKTFKLSKQTKRMMCSIVDPVSRNQYKKMMIQAELAAGVIIKREPRDHRATDGVRPPSSVSQS